MRPYSRRNILCPVVRNVLLGGLILLTIHTKSLGETAWQPDEFPISYWYGPPVSENKLETWQRVKDCNFTFCGPTGGYSLEENKKMFDFCRQVGIKAMLAEDRITWQMVMDDKWKEMIGQVVADYSSNPALYGYYIQDEPNHELFQALGQVSQELQRRDPKHLPYINLFPTYASVEQLGNPTYADHLEKYLGIVKPAVLSYDHYCLLKNGQDRPDYFENLALIREYGLRYGVPPWNIILSLPHLGYRDPSAGEMRWQVYTSLAYGMKGLMYFTYWTDKAWEAEKEIGIVHADGSPARLYPIVQQLNAEIKALGKTMLGLTSTGVFHTGPIPQGCTKLGADAPVQAQGEPPLVFGFFKEASGREYSMVVNRDHDKPVDVDLTFRSHITGATELTVRSEEKLLPLENHKAKLHLEAGDGKLFRLDTEFKYPEPPKLLPGIDFQFNTDGDLDGWGGFSSLTAPQVKNSVLTLTFTGNDPFLCRTFLRIDPDTYSKIKVRMKLPPCQPEGQLFWTTSDEPQFTDAKYLNFKVTPDGEWHEYEIPVGTHPRWKGKAIRAIRFDPTVGGATPGSKVEIDRITGE
ncbi:MAG: hypothetical protein HY318_01455 [Armatimonadetes bacterium]|nr:hypothetical protein [Armatimonadota bacterium]